MTPAFRRIDESILLIIAAFGCPDLSGLFAILTAIRLIPQQILHNFN
jgi:hypothetical protein